jgi:ABC-type transporter Mla MlaB component
MSARRRPAKALNAPQASRANRLALAGDLGLEQLEELKRRLDGVVCRARPVTLDVTQLERIHTAGLQLLAAFVRARQAQGRTVVWEGISPWLAEAIQQLGLAAALAAA